MFEITVEDEFAAAHRLDDYAGNCEHLHGHNWKVQASFRCKELNSLGLAIDFRVARKILKEALKPFDHSYLNSLVEFANYNPSCEHICQTLYFRIAELLLENESTRHVQISSIRVWESSGSSVMFHREND